MQLISMENTCDLPVFLGRVKFTSSSHQLASVANMPTRKSLSSAIEHAQRTNNQPHQPLSAASVEVQTEVTETLDFDSTSIQTEPLLCLSGRDLADKIQFEREGACLALIRRICETIEQFRIGHLLAANELSQAHSMEIGEKIGNVSNEPESLIERSERGKSDLNTGYAVVSTSLPLSTNASSLHSAARRSAVLPSQRVTSARAATRQRSAHSTGLARVGGVGPSVSAYDSVATARHNRSVALPAAGSVRSTNDPSTVEARQDTHSLDQQQRRTTSDAVDTQVNLFVGAAQCVRFNFSLPRCFRKTRRSLSYEPCVRL
jgi:hypothetical protein